MHYTGVYRRVSTETAMRPLGCNRKKDGFYLSISTQEKHRIRVARRAVSVDLADLMPSQFHGDAEFLLVMAQ